MVMQRPHTCFVNMCITNIPSHNHSECVYIYIYKEKQENKYIYVHKMMRTQLEQNREPSAQDTEMTPKAFSKVNTIAIKAVPTKP